MLVRDWWAPSTCPLFLSPEHGQPSHHLPPAAGTAWGHHPHGADIPGKNGSTEWEELYLPLMPLTSSHPLFRAVTSVSNSLLWNVPEYQWDRLSTLRYVMGTE